VRNKHKETPTFPALVTMLALLSYAKYVTWLINSYKIEKSQTDQFQLPTIIAEYKRN